MFLIFSVCTVLEGVQYSRSFLLWLCRYINLKFYVSEWQRNKRSYSMSHSNDTLSTLWAYDGLIPCPRELISLETIAPDNGNSRKIDSCLRRRYRGSGWNIIPENTDFDFMDTHANCDEIFHSLRQLRKWDIEKVRIYNVRIFYRELYRIIRNY